MRLQNEGELVTLEILRLPEEILFSRSKWELNQKGLEAVKSLADALDQVLPCYSMGLRSTSNGCPHTKAKVEAIFIEVHPDADPYRPPSPVEPRRPTSPQPAAAYFNRSADGSAGKLGERTWAAST